MCNVNRKDEVLDTIASVAVISKNEIRLDDDFVTIGIDSLRMVELIVALEDTFEITFEDGELDNSALKKVQDVVKLTEKYLSLKI